MPAMRSWPRAVLLAVSTAVLLITWLPSPPAGAAPSRAVEIRLAPAAPDLQMVVWIETAVGAYVDTAYITRLTGQFGLGNRPGAALLKTNFRWPFSRREMVAPVWAHRRGKHYPQVVMGGACGNTPNSRCSDGSLCKGDCEDSTIAYHSRISSYEPFYCSPSGGVGQLDALSCASKGTFPKGAYADPPAFSLYPPRADLAAMNPAVDSRDLLDFAKQNDLVAISRATPPPGRALEPALTWYPRGDLADGEYVAWVELSQESDFNQFHNHPNQPDSVSTWDFEGHPFLGQPSVVYRVPFRLDRLGWTAVTDRYAGYGAWDGQDGDLRPPDDTITVGLPGTGAGRLGEVNDGLDHYRVKVVAGQCDAGAVPERARDLTVSTGASHIDVSFRPPAAGEPPNRYQVRYREGDAIIADEAFDGLIAAPDPGMTPDANGLLRVRIEGLLSATAYSVAVRGVSRCNRRAPIAVANTATPERQFTTLKGCFVATAAYGSTMAPAVAVLRRLRDERLLNQPAGRLFTASYYSFSPPVASAIASDEHLRAGARHLLTPFVTIARALR